MQEIFAPPPPPPTISKYLITSKKHLSKNVYSNNMQAKTLRKIFVIEVYPILVNVDFVIFFFLGMLEHKYLKRMKIVKPRPSVGNFERCYYQPKDLFVGNVIYVRGRAFLLMDADEYTYDYMERNCHSVSWINWLF